MYRYPKITLAGALFLYFFIVVSCRESNTLSGAVEEVTYSPVPTTEEKATLHTDTVSQYEFRTGESGNYKYNYDVIGIDSLGNAVTGNVSMKGKYGAGIINTEDGNEIEVTLEWVGYGELKAEDDDGNVWDLIVE